MKSHIPFRPDHAAMVAALAFAASVFAAVPNVSRAQTPPSDPNPSPPAAPCPGPNFIADLQAMLASGAAFPTANTVIGASDCAFHEWSWEAFLWATALENGVPRFMSLKTPADLSLASHSSPGTPPASASASPVKLTLGTRAAHAAGATTPVEGAGAIVEADGNLLVSPNGYPVYASVHMNDPYFQRAQSNLIVTGAYAANAGRVDDGFPVGAAVFKAMWLRLDDPSQAPAGAFVTQANVPVLTVFLTADNTLYAAPSGQTQTVSVALVGLHVVGRTVNHPEFIWGTFEHKANSPRFADGTFDPGSTASDPKSYTLYAAGTPYNQTNPQSSQTTATSTATPLSAPSTVVTTTLVNTPTYTFNPATQKFSPATNVVLANATGGETNSPQGPANIKNLNSAAQGFLNGLSPSGGGAANPQSAFANYDLIGTVWMAPGTLTLASNQSNAVGSVNLSNSTAETFVQNLAGTTTPNTVQNCFSCHNPQTFTDVAPMPNLAPRFVALSHVVSTGSLYAVPNLISVNAPPPPAATTPPAVPSGSMRSN